MHFASDNAGPTHPKIMAALQRANDGYQLGYGADQSTDAAVALMRDVFEAPDAEVFFVSTGTAANSLALAATSEPWQTVFCGDTSHVHLDECAAPEFYTGGSKLSLVDAPHGRISLDALTHQMSVTEGFGVHGVQPGPVTVTQATEWGTIYSLDHLRALSDIAHAKGQPVHMDGARFANALVTLECTPAEMTWRAGIDVLSFGGTKNGCLGVEAVVFFDPDRAQAFEFYRKRGGHLMSKHRFLSAQMEAYLTDGLWLDLAAQANAAAQTLEQALAQVPMVQQAYPREANLVFATWPRWLHRAMHEIGARYSIWEGSLIGDDPNEPLLARLACDWACDASQTDQFVTRLRQFMSERAA